MTITQAARETDVEIVARNLSKSFVGQGGITHEVLRRIDVDVYRGEFVCLVGRSGCGKTTLLNLIAGFEQPTDGSVAVGGRQVQKPGPDRTMVFQDYALFPWLNSQQNVEFLLRVQGVPSSERRAKAREALELVGLRGAGSRPIYKLSGGMKQRVALARALVAQPRVLLMDEPFAALDAQQRLDMQRELVRIWQATGQTIVFVTHSLEEAIFLADRILVLVSDPGRIAITENVTLPRPRDITGDEFNDIKRRLGRVLEAEAHRALAAEQAMVGRNDSDGQGPWARWLVRRRRARGSG